MKNTVLTMLAMAIILIAQSQSNDNQGTIIYSEVIQFDIQLDDMPEEMQAMMPTENRNKTILYFNDNTSLYENYEELEAAIIDEMSEGGSVQIMISQPEVIIYRDMVNKKTIEQTEFMTRSFLIESDNTKDEWKLTGNQKEILGYPCQEAIKKGEKEELKVWFTPAIPVSTGPAQYANLPGLVLEISEENGSRTIIAESVQLGEIDENKIKKPKKGKKVTRAEYRRIVEEKTKEMGDDGESSGSQTIIMKISQ